MVQTERSETKPFMWKKLNNTWWISWLWITKFVHNYFWYFNIFSFSKTKPSNLFILLLCWELSINVWTGNLWSNKREKGPLLSYLYIWGYFNKGLISLTIHGEICPACIFLYLSGGLAYFSKLLTSLDPKSHSVVC